MSVLDTNWHISVVSFISLQPVLEAKRRAVGTADLLVVSSAASSAFGVEDMARASIVYRVDVIPS